MKPKATLTDQDIAAIESGAELSAAGTVAAQTPAEIEAAAVVAAAAAAEAEAAAKAAAVAAEAQATADAAAATAAAAAEAQATADAAAAATAAAAAAAAAATSQADVVGYLQSQVKEKDAQLLAANVSLKTQETKLAGMEASHNGLLDIARASIGKMQVALGGSAVDLTASDALTVLAEHARVAKLFSEKFKVGGVAATAIDGKAAAAAAEAAEPVSAMRAAQVQAARLPKSK